MAPRLNQFKVDPCVQAKPFLFLPFRTQGYMPWLDLLITWSPSVVSLQLTVNPPAKTVAHAAGHILACVAQASRAPAVKRWLQNRCTSVIEVPWGVFNLAPTPSRKTNHRKGPQKETPLIPQRPRPHDLRLQDSQPTLRKWLPNSSYFRQK